MWALKVEKDGHDPNTFSSLKEILRLVIICQGKFSVYFFSRSLSLSVYYFSINC